MMVVAICSVMLAFPVKDYDESMVACLEVASGAMHAGEPPHVLVALSYMESRLDYDAVSRKGAVGPLQVMPYWLEDACGLVDAGVIAWVYWRQRSITIRTALAKYNAGYRPGRRSFRFADRVLNLSSELLVLAEGVSGAD